MGPSLWKRVSIALVALFDLIGNIGCGPYKDRSSSIYKSGRLNDVAQATTLMQKYLPHSLSLEVKCKRYAVLAERAMYERFPQRKTVIDVANMNEEDLETRYGQLNTTRIAWLYMSTIDRYRISQLGTPIIDLVECLRMLDTSASRIYLNNPEISIILVLYKQVLGMSDTALDVQGMDFKKYFPSFRETLRNLFKEYMDIDGILGDASAETDKHIESASALDAESKTNPQNRRTESPRLERSSYTQRENQRLFQQRVRVAKPEKVQKYREDRRKRYKEQRLLLSKPVNTPEESEAQRVAKMRFERMSERQRRRRKAIRERKQQQQVERLCYPPQSLEAKDVEQHHHALQIDPTVHQPILRTNIALEGIELQQSSDPLAEPVAPEPSQQVDLWEPSLEHSMGSNNLQECDRYEQNMAPFNSIIDDTNYQHCWQSYKCLSDHEATDEQSQWNSFVCIMSSFEPETQEERQFHQYLIDCANQSDDSDAIMRLLSNAPQSSRASTGTGAASPDSLPNDNINAQVE